MKDYKYYTPKGLASKIIELIENKPYENVIDICCGSWNLLHAAKEKLNCHFITGVDLDENVKKYRMPKEKFFQEDGREYALRYYRKKKYELVLSNPPFGLLSDDDRIMKENLTNHSYTPILNKRFENEMLVANMLLVKQEGVLIAVLPQTFVLGISNLNVRKEITKEFQIDAIIKLPEGTFKRNDIRACAVIMRKSKKSKGTILYEALHSDEWVLNVIESIDSRYINSGCWENCNSTVEKKYDVLIFRGRINSKELQENGRRKIYHCSSLIEKGIWKPSVKRVDGFYSDRTTEIGDILINRIGKMAGYWCICHSRGYLVSDCIIVIRNASRECIRQLENNSCEGRLNIPLRGVSTQYITKSDIQKLMSI